MASLVTKTFGAGKQIETVAALQAFIKAADPVATDAYIVIDCYESITQAQWGSFKEVGPVSASDTQRVLMRPAPGLAWHNLVDGNTLNTGNEGLFFNLDRDQYNFFLGGLDIAGFNTNIGGPGGGHGAWRTATGKGNTHDNIFRFMRFFDTGTSGGTALHVGLQYNQTLVADCLLVTENPNSTLAATYDSQFKRCTFVARGAALGGPGTAIDLGYDALSENNVFIGYDAPLNGGANRITNCFTNRAITGGRNTNVTVVTGANALVVNDSNNFKPKPGGALIGAATDSAKSTEDVFTKNRGMTPDVGAAQSVAALPLPTGTITNITVNGRTITVSGTTQNNPSQVRVGLDPTNRAYNGATNFGLKLATLGTNTFTVSFENATVGEYSPKGDLSSPGGPGALVNNAGFGVVTGAVGTVTSQNLDVQVLRLTGTTTGNPTSGTLLVVADPDDPAGAQDMAPVAIPLGSGTFDVSVAVPPGKWGKPVLRFSTAAGPSFPAEGAPLTGFTIISISGNPEAPNPGNDTPPPANPAPTVIGSIANVTGTAGSPVNPVNAASAFSDTDVLKYTKSPVSAWPAGLDVDLNTGSITGTVGAPLTSNTPRVRATDTAGQFIDSNPFSVVIGAAVVTPPPDPSTPTRTVSFKLTSGRDANGNIVSAANLTGLMVSFYAAAGPHAMTSALYQSSTETTDGEGVLHFTMTTNAIAAGAQGLLLVMGGDKRHFLGLVTVA